MKLRVWIKGSRWRKALVLVVCLLALLLCATHVVDGDHSDDAGAAAAMQSLLVLSLTLSLCRRPLRSRSGGEWTRPKAVRSSAPLLRLNDLFLRAQVVLLI